MKTIFFDLETSDLNPVGQILNFAFVTCDEDWNVVSTYADKIRLSRLQLPSPEAIMATNIDVFDYDNPNLHPEHIVLAKIQQYIHSVVERDETRLVGYNSSRFDIPYLRTSMIRNGLNPYFGGSIKYGDLLHVVRKLSCQNPSFKESLIKRPDGKPSFKLESVLKSFGLLQLNESQKHESQDDVHLTIKLSKYILDKYDVDVRTYNSYEVSSNHKKYDIIETYPYFDDKEVVDDSCYVTLLEQNKTQALWINISEFEEGKDRNSIHWYNKNSSALFVKNNSVKADNNLKARAEKAKTALSHINLQNFWPEKNCDIEQFIFMLPIHEIGALYSAIFQKDLFLLKEQKSKFASQLYLRYLCNNASIEQMKSKIFDYAMYRYGGKLKLSKEDFESKYEEGVYNPSFHETYKESLDKIQKLNNLKIFQNLEHYYKHSVIAEIAGKELLGLPDRV